MTNKLEKIIRLPEDHVDDNLLSQITELRRECFPDDNSGRAYFKQIPHFRYVVYSADKLIAQVGIDYRLMNFDGETKSVYGVVSLCVTEKHRDLGLASRLLDVILKDAISAKVDIILLMAKNPALYKKNGYQYLNAECKWLGIDDEKLVSLGLLVEKIDSELMMKNVVDKRRNYQNVDYLGYMF